MAGVLSTEMKNTINKKCMQQAPVNTIFSECVDILKAGNVIIQVRDANPELFFTHPKNRSGLGLSAHGAHRTGAKILAAGADMGTCSLVSFAFELQPEGKERQKQLDFNDRLIMRSKGLLAVPSGKERYLSVGAGHTVAFAKAAAFGCRTPQESIQDAEGKIDKQRLFKDKSFKAMIEVGWDWWVIPASVDRECPKLAHIAQRALNSNNHSASLCGELEAAQMMAESIEDAGSDDDVEDAAIETVRSMGAPCSAYAEAIYRFVDKYSGGPGAPHIKFIDAVTKEYHCTCQLGAGSPIASV